jgi:uncharacterized phage infection (PIP) family protein YhgE
MADPENKPAEGELAWQEKINELQGQVSQLALQLQANQTQLTEALAGTSSKAELEALKTELLETRQLLTQAQTDLQETLKQMQEQFQSKGAEDPPVVKTPQEPPQPQLSPRKRVWL